MDLGDVGGSRRVIDRIGTRAAAVPAAITSVKVGSSAYPTWSQLVQSAPASFEQHLSTYRSAFDLPAETSSNIYYTLDRYAHDDILRVGYHKRHITAVHPSSNEPAGAKFVNLRARGAIEMQRNAVSLVSCFVTPPQYPENALILLL